MQKSNIVIASVVAAVVSFAVFFITPPRVTVVEKEVAPAVSAVPSPILNSEYFSFGGVMQRAFSVRMNSATTTLCAVKSPAATSTLVYAGYQIFSGTSTAANIDIAKGTTQWATTTLLVTGTSVGSGATKEVSWTTAGATAADDIMSPNTYVLVKTATPGLGGYTYGGTCKVVFQEF